MTCQIPSNEWTDKGDGTTSPAPVNPVLSVHSRTGHVVALADDYAAFYADIAHNHDAVYAPIVHNHDGVYSAINHVHSVFSINVNGFVKAPGTENGWFLRDDGEWINPAIIPGRVEEAPADGEPKVRLGDTPEWLSASGLYAALVHNHDAAYSAIGHNHDAAYAAIGHNHDADYAALVHTHSAFAGAGTTGFVPDPISVSGRVLDDAGNWVAPGGAPVSSVFTRTGAVIAVGTDYAAFYKDIAYVPDWTDITSKPATFPPDAHVHAISEVTGLQTELDGKAAGVHTHVYADITDPPAIKWSGAEAAPSGLVLPADTVGIHSDADAGTRQPVVDDFLKATRGLQTIWAAGGGITVGVAGDFATLSQRDFPTGFYSIPTILFDAVTSQQALFNFIAPASWDLGTLKFAAIWCDDGTVGSGDVDWQINSLALRDGDNMDQLLGGAVGVTDVYHGVLAEYHKSPLSAAHTPTGTVGAGNMLQLGITRVAAADTYNQDVHLIGVEVLYGVNTYKDGEL